MIRIALLRPLAHRDFRLLWTGQSISMLGNAIYAVALPFQILALGGSAIQLGIGFAAFSGVQLAMILFGGALVDRLPRRNVILASDLASGVVVAVAAALGYAGALRIEHLYVLSAIFGFASSFYIPAMSAIMPELVPKDVLAAGNSLRGLSRQSTKLVGPLLGGIIVTTAGPPAALAIDAGTFVLSFGLFALAGTPSGVPKVRTPLLRSMREGVGFVMSVPWIWISIAGFGFVNVFYSGAFTVGMPLLVLDVLKGGAVEFGIIGSAAGVGQLLGSVITAWLGRYRAGPAMYACYALTALSLLGFGIAPSLLGAIAASAAFAASIMAANTLWETALQKHVPQALLGRATSVDYFGSFLSGPLAPLLAVAIASSWGVQWIFLAGGLVSFVFTIGAVALVPTIRDLE